jgi:ABC-type sugar transport system ATPase subunit
MTDIGLLKLDKERNSRLKDLAGKKVKAGIRPQSVYFSKHSDSRRHTDTEIELTVELVENLGDKYLVIGGISLERWSVF